MAITLPSIDITFKQLANTLIERSKRGIAVLIIKDDTDTTFNTKEYSNLSALEKDEALFTNENYQYILDALTFAVNKVVVVRVDTTETVTDALAIVEKTVKTGWITTVGTSTDYTTIINWIKAKEAVGETYKAIVYNATTANCKHVVNFVNTNVIFADDREEETGDKYLPSLAGILASCNVENGTTYFVCKNLKSVVEVENNDTAVNAGQFVLVNDVDKGVKVGLGVNSLTTFDDTNTEDMRYIDIIEAMDMISDDIRLTFRNDFVGKYKNNYDNQILFISAINTYFKGLADNEVLDSNYKNYADVDVNSQRAAWVLIKSEASTWDDTKVKNTTYKRNVYLAGDVKILGAMENLKFNITMA